MEGVSESHILTTENHENCTCAGFSRIQLPFITEIDTVVHELRIVPMQKDLDPYHDHDLPQGYTRL